MYVPLSWLKKFVNIDCSIKELSDRMTMTGTKVETVKSFGEKISGIVTGKILDIKQHPNADKLVVTKVDVGNEVLQIVTGAKNVFVGAIVPVAKHNSTLYDGSKIKKSKLRGETSEGMMCSIQELGYNKSQYPESPEDGIYIFQDDVELGLDVCDVLQLKEDVIDFEVTSNRPDCLSILGIAREAAATFNNNLSLPEIRDLDFCTDKNDRLEIDIRNFSCNRYIAQIIDDVKIESSPLWLRHRLISCGINPINNIVDITNYVMLELGQPLHAFDLKDIASNKIIVDISKGETVKTLDGIERKLDDNMLLIKDSEKVLAVAGVMGCDSSKINENTQSILIESANFDGYSVRNTSKKLNLRTDASSRYEKNLDPNLTEVAIKRVCYLIEKLGCGKINSRAIDIYPNKIFEQELRLEPEKINKLLGTNISEYEMINILSKIGLKIDDNGNIKIPTFRRDIESCADIGEEVLRFYGYDKISSTLPFSNSIGTKSHKKLVDEKIKNSLVSQGVYEIKNFSFQSPVASKKFILNTETFSDEKNSESEFVDELEPVKIVNPLGEEFSVMRTNTIDDMLKCLSFNVNKKNPDTIFFELGKIYEENPDDLPAEKKLLTIGSYGNKINFFDIKGLLEKLFVELNIDDFDSQTSEFEFLHPYRQAKIFKDGNVLGFLGQAKPQLAKEYSIKQEAYLAVISLEKIYSLVKDSTVKFKPMPKFPSVERDIALLVSKDKTCKELCDTISKHGKNILEKVELFDVYQGPQVETNMKSLAYKLIFRSSEKTLTEDEVNSIMDNIISALKNEHDATLR